MGYREESLGKVRRVDVGEVKRGKLGSKKKEDIQSRRHGRDSREREEGMKGTYSYLYYLFNIHTTFDLSKLNFCSQLPPTLYPGMKMFFVQLR